MLLDSSGLGLRVPATWRWLAQASRTQQRICAGGCRGHLVPPAGSAAVGSVFAGRPAARAPLQLVSRGAS
eukprot:7013055-Alexandrium_andersonii.AAC.1